MRSEKLADTENMETLCFSPNETNFYGREEMEHACRGGGGGGVKQLACMLTFKPILQF